MMTQLIFGKPGINPFEGFYKTYYPFTRILIHVSLWICVWLIERYYFGPRLFKDNSLVTSLGSLTEFVQTIALFYLIGYYLLPKLLYRKKYLVFLVLLFFLYFIIYQLNYSIFNYLLTISGGKGVASDTYVRKIVPILTKAGTFGCFVDLQVFFWNYAYGFFFVNLFLFVKGFKDLIDYQARIVTVERERYELELNFLKAQVNPHFLFNTLNSVYSQVFDTNEKAADLVLRLSELMRYNLYETDQPRIALNKELGYVQNYLNLERNRLADRDVVIDYAQSGQPDAYQIAPLLLIAFVENAFKHGVQGATEPAYVQVRVDVCAGQLVFEVANSVPPQRVVGESGKKSGGVGLVNVRRRLDTLYPGGYTLAIEPGEEVYTVTLCIEVESATIPLAEVEGVNQ